MTKQTKYANRHKIKKDIPVGLYLFILLLCGAIIFVIVYKGKGEEITSEFKEPSTKQFSSSELLQTLENKFGLADGSLQIKTINHKKQLNIPVNPNKTLSLAFRLVPSFAHTARTVMQAQRARGLDLDSGGPFHRFRKSLPAVVPTLGYALRSADDLTRALETRGLGAGRRRTEYRHLEQGKTDIAALAIVAAFALACIAARVTLNVGELLPRL